MRRGGPPGLHPARIVAVSFAAVVAVGTALLSLPAATVNGTRIPLIDAFFTAVSATCVTGLLALDTSAVFSLFGQIVILACIQIGGLGLMTLTTILLVAFGRRLAIADRTAVQDSFHHSRSPRLGTLIKYIVAGTFATEAAGAAILSVYWIATHRFDSAGTAIYHAVFHSISAFCNAGFALYTDNLVRFRDDPLVLAVISLLVIAGGLGFLVGLDLKDYLQHKYSLRWTSPGTRPVARLSLHTKLVLIGSAGLLVAGTVSYYLLERETLFAEMSGFDAWLNAFFCSVTRTAGFNTVDYTRMSSPSLLCTMVLMIIGASPGSTGGGIKTSTFVLLVAYAYSRWRGNEDLHIFRRRVPQEVLDKAQSVVFVMLAAFVLAVSALIGVEARGLAPAESHKQFLRLSFETASALGTAGLSMGQTPLLSMPGKLILMLLMFMGRVGPLTLALAISIRRSRGRFRYADENVMVG